jgi:Flp pilus assembly protein TadG
MDPRTQALAIALGGLRARLRRLREDETGASTLEIVIITLGLIAVAAILVAALTAAVTRRTEQIQ